jgi:SAM-dependent methyltransferase
MQSNGASQKKQYESIHDAYEDHYYDDESMAYRDRFYYDPLFKDLHLDGCAVADIAAGSGHNSLALLRRFPNAKVTGFDISTAACAAFRSNVGRPCIEADLTQPLVYPDKFDVTMIVGGLHHCIANLPAVLQNLANLLKPGGMALLVEPNREFILDWLRRFWYKVDLYFDSTNERALAHSEVIKLASTSFTPENISYYGGPAYFLISQSLLFRMPKAIKRTISPGLVQLEVLYNRVPGRWIHPYFVARWVRIGSN